MATDHLHLDNSTENHSPSLAEYPPFSLALIAGEFGGNFAQQMREREQIMTKAPIVVAEPRKLGSDEEIDRVSAAHAANLVQAMDDSASTFERARLSYAAYIDGANFRKVAHTLSVLIAQGRTTSPERVQEMATVSPRKGGTKVAHTTLFAYAGGWQMVVDAQLTPSPELVQRGVTLMMTSNTAEGRKALVPAVQNTAEGKRASAFLEGAENVLGAARKAVPSSEGRPEGNTKASALSAADVVAFLATVNSAAWNAKDSETIAVALNESLDRFMVGA